MVWATLIPLRGVTEPPPNLEQLTLPVMVTLSESDFMDDWAADVANAASGAGKNREKPCVNRYFFHCGSFV